MRQTKEQKQEVWDILRPHYRSKATIEEKEQGIRNCVTGGYSKDECPAVFDDEDRAFYDRVVRNREEIYAKGGIVITGEYMWREDD